jgi:hypothetical protein
MTESNQTASDVAINPQEPTESADSSAELPQAAPPTVEPTKPTPVENDEIEQLKGQAQLAQNIYMNRSVSAEVAMNLAKDFMELVNKRFGQTKFAQRISKVVVKETKTESKGS